jgi:hypothetical protein
MYDPTKPIGYDNPITREELSNLRAREPAAKEAAVREARTRPFREYVRKLANERLVYETVTAPCPQMSEIDRAREIVAQHEEAGKRQLTGGSASPQPPDLAVIARLLAAQTGMTLDQAQRIVTVRADQARARLGR